MCLLLGVRASWLLLYARVSFDVGVWSAKRLRFEYVYQNWALRMSQVSLAYSLFSAFDNWPCLLSNWRISISN